LQEMWQETSIIQDRCLHLTLGSRGVLDLACQIQYLTDSFLWMMIDRCMALELSHLLNPTFRYIQRPLGNRCPQRRPLGQQYQQQNSGPPSWTERERTSRAYWRLQLFFDLRATAAASKLKWPFADLAQLQSMSVESFWEKKQFGRNQHEHVKTVVELLQEEIEAHSIVSPIHISLKFLCQLPRTDGRLWSQRPPPQL